MKSNVMQSMFCREQKLALSVALILGFIFSGSSIQGAEGAKFPYDASIFTDDVEVHSGPGSKFYVTGKLKKGVSVRVHRHDPGGWYMIAPPSGSFSLVRAEYVKKESPKQGIVTENSVVVRVGSQLNDHQEVEQRRLMKGERVSIIGEHHYTDRGRTILMLKIEPPRGEFRWVKGEFVVPNDPSQRKIHDSDPYAFPSNGIEINPDSKPEDKRTTPAPRPGKSVAEDKNKLPRPGFEQPVGNEGVAGAGHDPQLLQRDRSILDALDRNFRDMIQQDISTWNLRDLAHDYKKLQGNTQISPIASQVDLRLQAMERYRKMKAEYDDLVKLTSGTEMRDAQLLSMQKTTEVAGMFPSETPDMGEDPRLAMAPRSHDHSDFPFPGHSQGVSPGVGFAGAGIVKKVGNWDGKTPAYVLVSPSDKLLSYLEPVPGVNLEQAVGQSVGIFGNRRSVPELRSDLIHVTGLAPVRLQQR